MAGHAMIEIQTGLTPNVVELLNNSLRLVAIYLGMLLYKRMTGQNALSSPKTFATSLVVALVLHDVLVLNLVRFA